MISPIPDALAVWLRKAFIPNSLNLSDVHHKNGKQKWNNAVSNLSGALVTGTNNTPCCTDSDRVMACTLLKPEMYGMPTISDAYQTEVHW